MCRDVVRGSSGCDPISWMLDGPLITAFSPPLALTGRRRGSGDILDGEGRASWASCRF